MKIKTLYRYERDDGGITVSPDKPSVSYTELYRLIADEGKKLTNGTTTTSCIDVYDTVGWTEIEAPEENKESEVIL